MSNANVNRYSKETSNDFQEPMIPHRTNVTAADTSVPTLSPHGWNGFTTFQTLGAVTVELRLASDVDTGTTKSLDFRVLAWPYARQDSTLNDNRGGVLHGAGVTIIDSQVATSGQPVTGHPFSANSGNGTTFFMADQEGTVTYEVDGMIKRFPETAANAATHELRYLIDVQGYEHLYVPIDAIPSGARVEVGFRRVG